MPPTTHGSDPQATRHLRETYGGGRNKLADAARRTFVRTSTHESSLGDGDVPACPGSRVGPFTSSKDFRKSVSAPCISQPYAPSHATSPIGDGTVVSDITCDDLRRLCHRTRPPRLKEAEDSSARESPETPLDLHVLDDLLFSKTPQGRQAGGPRKTQARSMSTTRARRPSHLANLDEDTELNSDQLQDLTHCSPSLSMASQLNGTSVQSDRRRASIRSHGSTTASAPRRKGGALEDPEEAKVNRWKAERRQWLMKDPEYMEETINDLRRSKRRFRLVKSQMSERELWENANLYSDYAVKVKRNSERQKEVEFAAPSLSPPRVRGAGVASGRKLPKGPSGGGGQDSLKKEVRNLQVEMRRSLERMERANSLEGVTDRAATSSIQEVAGALGNHFRLSVLRAGGS